MEPHSKVYVSGIGSGMATVLLVYVLLQSRSTMETCQPCPDELQPTSPMRPPSLMSKAKIASLEAVFAASNIQAATVVTSLKQRYSSGSILVIGANVGDTWNDPVWWWMKSDDTFDKILIEPIPRLFTKLEANVAAAGMKRTTLVNAAISSTVGERGMYCWKLNETGAVVNGLPAWLAQVCSFRKRRLTSNTYDTGKFRFSHHGVRRDRIDDYIVEYKVQTLTVPTLLQKYRVRNIRYVQIDTEGFDYRVVMQLPFHDPSFRPDAIMYEDVLLSKPHKDLLREMFHRHGYVLKAEDQNMVAYRALE